MKVLHGMAVEEWFKLPLIKGWRQTLKLILSFNLLFLIYNYKLLI